MRKCGMSIVRMGLLAVAMVGLFCSLSFAAPLERQTLELKMGGSDLVTTTHPFRRVSIADPTIADVVVLSPRELYVFGKKVGYTSIIVSIYLVGGAILMNLGLVGIYVGRMFDELKGRPLYVVDRII